MMRQAGYDSDLPRFRRGVALGMLADGLTLVVAGDCGEGAVDRDNAQLLVGDHNAFIGVVEYIEGELVGASLRVAVALRGCDFLR